MANKLHIKCTYYQIDFSAYACNQSFAIKSTQNVVLRTLFCQPAEVNEAVAQPPPEEEEDQNEDQDVPDLTNFTIEELKQYVMFLNFYYKCACVCIDI